MNLKQTPLYEIHLRLGAKMVPFADWAMPVNYSAGIIKEHKAVRTKCGLFDVSHMGRIEITGPKALGAIQRLTTNDASRLIDGQVQYTLLCYENGGVVDDITLYRFNKERYILCVNASNTEKVYKWIKEHIGSLAMIQDLSSSIAQMALQGQLSYETLQPLVDKDLAGLEYYHFIECNIAGEASCISRTGYTGEDGFEIYIPVDLAGIIWQTIMDSGEAAGILPVGLGARDILRLEKGFPLYGHELGEKQSLAEAGLERFISFDKNDFSGKEVLENQIRNGVKRRLMGIEVLTRGIARQNCHVMKDGTVIGNITSGTYSPTLNKPIALGYIEAPFAKSGITVQLDIRKKLMDGMVVKTPFYKRPVSAKRT